MPHYDIPIFLPTCLSIAESREWYLSWPILSFTMNKQSTHYRDIPPYETRDGSQIRELMHPSLHAAQNQSLAEARVFPGQKTVLHRHHLSEEFYHVTAGSGVMTLGDEQFRVEAGDTVCIPSGTPHCIENDGNTDLTILCCCSPAYSHDDTELLAQA
jgi:mannose-6-phosphate isomerase-like protein (cupin superfamily)